MITVIKMICRVCGLAKGCECAELDRIVVYADACGIMKTAPVTLQVEDLAFFDQKATPSILHEASIWLAKKIGQRDVTFKCILGACNVDEASRIAADANGERICVCGCAQIIHRHGHGPCGKHQRCEHFAAEPSMTADGPITYVELTAVKF